LHGKDQRISAGLNDSILTEDLSTINEGIPTVLVDSDKPEREPTELSSELPAERKP
jgi:hypothetical protein